MKQEITNPKKEKAHVQQLLSLGACNEAVEHAAQFSSLQEAWDACTHGEWMIWFARKMPESHKLAERKKFVLAACACARTVLKYVPKNVNQPTEVIELAEAWANDEKSAMPTNTHSNTAYLSDATVHPACASAYAAHAAILRPIYGYAAIMYAANFAVYAAGVTKQASLKHYADIIRKFYPKISWKS